MDLADVPPVVHHETQMEERMEHGEQVHLLLSAPGQPPASLPASPWRGWLPSDRGPIDPATAARGLRLSPVTPRAERALVAAVADDDVDALGRMAAQGGPTQDAARVLSALRLATVDPGTAVDLLSQLATAPSDPTDSKVFRKHWSTLSIQADLAPSVPALVGLGRSAFALLAAELLVHAGRFGDAIELLETVPPRPPIVLAKAAALLAHGDHARVLEVTATLDGSDDVSALALVARSVAARSLQDMTVALDATCAALAGEARSSAVVAAALEERAHLYSLAGDTTAAHADLEALAALTAGSGDVTIPPPASPRRADEPSEEDALDRARKRIARRITGVGAPGTFGGRHHSTYRDEIATMFALGQVDAVEELLLGLLDVVEDEVDELGVPLDATFFLTLADLYQDNDRADDLCALRERYAAADARAARRTTEVAEPAGQGSGDPAGFGAAAPAAVSAYLPPPPFASVEPVEDDEVLAHQLVSVLAGPTAASPVEAPATGLAPAVADDVIPIADGSPVDDGVAADEASPADTPVGDAPVGDEPPIDAPARDAIPEVPETDAEPAGRADGPGAAEVDLAEPERARRLTAVERAVRGPRVRSL